MSDTEKIKERISIVDLISETVALKKAGRNFKGLCPFHGEKTPSFVVSPERQIWHCFGCNKGGDIFTFLMELDRLEFPEALKILADRAGVKLETSPVNSTQGQLKERLLEMHHLAHEFYKYLLIKHPVGVRAQSYLKERGITEAAVKTFGLGFVPNSWDNLTKFLHKKRFTDKELELSGLALRGRSGLYDRFRNRVMFPLKNYRGDTVAFSGRLMDKDIKEAKYINSPETVIYTKGNELYGLNVTKDAIRKAQTAIVVEGEFDAISSFQAGVANVVAIKGSALTEAQVRLLKRFTEKIILALDQDAAGDAAMRRGIEIADMAGMDIRVVSIPTGKDPDEAARENPALWKKTISQPVPYWDFLISSAFARHDSNDPYGMKKISDELLPLFARISNTIIQAHYLKILSQKLSISEDKINQAMLKIKIPFKPADTFIQAQPQKSHDQMLEEHLLTLVLQSADIKDALHRVSENIDPSDLSDPVVKKIFMALIDHDYLDLADFSNSLPAELVPVFNRLYLTDLPEFSDARGLSKELDNSVISIKKAILHRKIADISAQITKSEAKQDETGIGKLNQELVVLSSSLKQIR